MAVVFISPKQRQRTFFMGITVVFLLLLIVVSLTVFLSKPKEILTPLTFNKPKVDIDMSAFDSDQFEILQPFSEMQIQYSYKATDDKKKEVTGFISATSVEEAKTFLTDRGLAVTDIKETEIGRDNPFIPYYQVPPPTTPGVRLQAR